MTDFNTQVFLEVNGKTCGGGDDPFFPFPELPPDFDCDPTGKAVSYEFFSILNQMYLVAVQSSDDGSTSTGNFGLSLLEYQRPVNNLCEDAILLEPGSVETGSTVNATLFDSGYVYANRSPVVFYKFLGTGSPVRFSTCSTVTNFNTEIFVETQGKTCGGDYPFFGSPVSGLDLACDTTGKAVFVEVETVVNQIYLVAVQSKDLTGRGAFGLSMQSPVGASPTSPVGVSPTTQVPAEAPIATVSPKTPTDVPSLSPSARAADSPTSVPSGALATAPSPAPISPSSGVLATAKVLVSVVVAVFGYVISDAMNII
jgi:hypothetical protein